MVVNKTKLTRLLISGKMAKILLESLNNLNPQMIAGLENMKFGVEFEFLLISSKAKAYLKANNLKISGAYGETFSITAADKILFHAGLSDWEAKEDTSIHTEKEDGSEEGVEIVSPPMSGIDGLNQIIKFCSVFCKLGKVNETCGLHVHVDANDWITEKMPNKEQAERITALLLRFKSFESLFDAQVAAWRKKNNSEYSKASDSEEKILAAYKKTVSSQYFKNYNLEEIARALSADRYRKLNIHSLFKFGTVEFRQLQGTLDAEKVIRWIILCLSFLQSAKNITGAYQEVLKSVAQEMKTSDVSQVVPPSVAPKKDVSERVEAAQQTGAKLLKYVDSPQDIDNLVLHIVEACYKRSFNPDYLNIATQIAEIVSKEPGKGYVEAKGWLHQLNGQGSEVVTKSYLLGSVQVNFERARYANLASITQGVRIGGAQSLAPLTSFQNLLPAPTLVRYVLDLARNTPNYENDPLYKSFTNIVKAQDQKLEISLAHAMFDIIENNYNVQPLWEISLRRLLTDKKAKEIGKKITQAQGKPDFKKIVPPAAQPFVLKQKKTEA